MKTLELGIAHRLLDEIALAQRYIIPVKREDFHVWDRKVAVAKKIDEAVLLQTRLSPDQFPLVRQIQIMTNSAKNGSARVSGVEAPKHADKEASFAELKTRIAETITFLETIDENAFNAGADKQIVFPLGKLYKGEMKGDDYVTHFMIANFYFHFTMAYSILRHSGVDIGKMSFLGSIPMTRTAV